MLKDTARCLPIPPKSARCIQDSASKSEVNNRNEKMSSSTFIHHD